MRVLGDAERAALSAQVSRGTRLIVTGTDATGLPSSDAVRRFPECPGRAYLAGVETDFEKTNPSAAADVIKAFAPDRTIRVDASPSVATDIVRVGGKLHIFLANFDGLVAGQNAVQTPQKGIRVSVPAAGAARPGSCPSWAKPLNSGASARTKTSCSCCPRSRKVRSCGSRGRHPARH